MGGSPEPSTSNLSLGPNQVSFEIDESVYPLDALYGACYLFVDRCFVFLTRPRAQVVGVQLKTRESAPAADLERLAGEFANELLSQALRLRLSQSSAKIREYYTAAALRAAASAPSIDELLAELESEELGEDPLEIMVPWEEKHGTSATEPADTKKDPEIGGG
jgi:His-Xaa-Ser system protein HxsD